MKVKIIHGVCIAPGHDTEPGDIVEVDPWFGRQLIHQGRAKAVNEDEIPEPGPLSSISDPSTINVRDPKPAKKK